MATVDDVREIALALPDAFERASGHTGQPGWRVKSGQFAWLRGPTATDERQLAEIGRAWPDGPVLAVRVSTPEETDALVAADPDVYFTIPHFAGWPGVLVRLEAVDRDRLEEIVTEAWLVRVPARVATAWAAERGLE